MRLPFVDHLPAKEAARWVMIAAILLLLIAFQFAIRPTLALVSQHSALSKSDLDPVQLNSQIQAYQQELAQIDATIGTEEYDRIALFDRCGVLAQNFNLKLLDFAPEEVYLANAGVQRIVNQIRLQGSYKGVLQFAHAIEEQEKLSAVVSLSFDYKKNLRTRKQNLIATLYLENLNLSNLK